MQELLVPVKENAQQVAIKEAKQEAETTTINTLTAQLMAQQAHGQKGMMLADAPTWHCTLTWVPNFCMFYTYMIV